MSQNEIREKYFDWLYDLVCKNRFPEENSYRKLLFYLHSTKFTYRLRSDGDRASDGINLRRRFANQHEDFEYVRECLDGPCTVLEMMVALAIKCEETIMTDLEYGDRTGQWFWRMVVNLGLGGMSDKLFDEFDVENYIQCFLKRKYGPDGCGGLFTIKNRKDDLRTVDIWTQMMWYLDSMM